MSQHSARLLPVITCHCSTRCRHNYHNHLRSHGDDDGGLSSDPLHGRQSCDRSSENVANRYLRRFCGCRHLPCRFCAQSGGRGQCSGNRDRLRDPVWNSHPRCFAGCCAHVRPVAHASCRVAGRVHSRGGQVVAAANIYDPAVSDLATAVKLGRVVCLAIVVAIVGIIERRVVEVRHERAHVAGSGKRPPLIPAFVAGFLAAVAVASLFSGVPAVSNVLNTLESTVATLLVA